MPTVDVCFRVTGDRIPADHAYPLFRAVSAVVPAVHALTTAASGEAEGSPDIGIHSIQGRAVGQRETALLSTSRLAFRIAAEHIAELLPLAGKRLILNGCGMVVGIPEVRPLVPAARLRSRLVTIKGFLEPEAFLEAAARQLSLLDVRGIPALVRRRSTEALEGRAGPLDGRCPFVRRTLGIHGKEVVGYAVEVGELTAEESVRLQEAGLGGRRHFGCGLFVPAK